MQTELTVTGDLDLEFPLSAGLKASYDENNHHTVHLI